MSSHYQLLPSKEYIADLINSIDQASTRVSMIALTIAEDAATRELIDALCRASQRGVKVDIGFDLYFTYREIEQASSRWSYFWHRTRLIRDTKKRLERSGAKVRWLGQFGVILFSRRTHIKWSVVDTTAYSFGGVNLYHFGIESVDYMFKVDDKVLADEIAEEHRRVIASDRAGHGYSSHLFGTVKHTVLVDGGNFLDSIIYRHALSYAKEASEVIYVSQYCPSGRLGRVLRHHPNTKLYFNPPTNANDMFNRALIRWAMLVHKIATGYHEERYLHAKFMIFTMPNGKEVAITGSHNFVAAGGLLGTREVALETTDPAIIDQLRNFLDKHIRTAEQ